jgi:leucine dehydrogenase
MIGCASAYRTAQVTMSLWSSPEFDDHEQVCLFSAKDSGLRAIVAIHSTRLGSAAGGTRFMWYPTDADALDDALRLSRAMSYKCALAGLPCGGGKAVIIGDPNNLKSKSLLHDYGRFLNRIGGTFATGEDVGMSVSDVETVREVSPFVGGTSKEGAGDPSIHTATGIVHGMRAVLKRVFSRDAFAGVSIAIQGLGAVGWNLAQKLHEQGACLTVADVRPQQLDRAVSQLGATVVSPEKIHMAPVDIFSPCALGGILTEQTVKQIRARAVAGAANNQLATPAVAAALAAAGILYAPDYVVNAGGVISGLESYLRMPGRSGSMDMPLAARLAGIEARLEEIFDRSERDKRTPDSTAGQIARELIGR